MQVMCTHLKNRGRKDLYIHCISIRQWINRLLENLIYWYGNVLMEEGHVLRMEDGNVLRMEEGHVLRMAMC